MQLFKNHNFNQLDVGKTGSSSIVIITTTCLDTPPCSVYTCLWIHLAPPPLSGPDIPAGPGYTAWLWVHLALGTLASGYTARLWVHLAAGGPRVRWCTQSRVVYPEPCRCIQSMVVYAEPGVPRARFNRSQVCLLPRFFCLGRVISPL